MLQNDDEILSRTKNEVQEELQAPPMKSKKKDSNPLEFPKTMENSEEGRKSIRTVEKRTLT